MKPSVALNLHRRDIRRIVKKYRACKPKLFGSVLYDNDTDKSDLDPLIEPTNDIGKTN